MNKQRLGAAKFVVHPPAEELIVAPARLRCLQQQPAKCRLQRGRGGLTGVCCSSSSGRRGSKQQSVAAGVWSGCALAVAVYHQHCGELGTHHESSNKHRDKGIHTTPRQGSPASPRCWCACCASSSRRAASLSPSSRRQHSSSAPSDAWVAAAPPGPPPAAAATAVAAAGCCWGACRASGASTRHSASAPRSAATLRSTSPTSTAGRDGAPAASSPAADPAAAVASALRAPLRVAVPSACCARAAADS